jgi:hypothetical protein
VFPRAKLLIRDTTDPEIVYDNVQLMDKSSLAIAEAIKRYQVPIEKMTLNNNGIKSSEFCLMIDCMTKHFEKL